MNRIVAAILCVSSFLIASNQSKAQKETWTWWFGGKIALKFDDINADPTIIQISNQAHSGPSKVEGCASISDKDGNLLFFSDGRNIFDKNDNIMPNGDRLSGSRSSTQGAMIIKQPGDNTNYYLITSPPRFDTNDQGLNAGSGFRYTIVDMSLRGGLGDVTTKDEQLFRFSPEKLSATTDETCNNIWVMGYDGGTKEFKAYKLGENGIDNNPVASPGPLAINNGNASQGIWGNMEFSPDGETLAVVFPHLPWPEISGIYLYNFDKGTGELETKDTIKGDFYCAAFSSNSEVLYATTTNFVGGGPEVFQFNLAEDDINGSKKSLERGGFNAGHPKLGPDGKIYIPRSCDNDDNNACNGAGFTVINDPNNVDDPGYQKNFLNADVPIIGYGSPEMFFVPFTKLTLEEEHEDTECAPEGKIILTGKGGTPPYVYSIDGGNTFVSTNIFENLWPGDYEVVIKDAHGCVVRDLVTIEGSEIEIIEDVSSTPDTCDNCNGTITVVAPHGDSPWTYYLIQDGDTLATETSEDTIHVFTELCMGEYEVIAQEKYGCLSKEKIEVGEEIVPVPITFPPMGPYCVYGDEKTLKSEPGGGIWTGPGVVDGEKGTFDPQTAGTGTHTITYTIEGKCGNSATIDIEVTEKLVASIDEVDALCINADPVELVGRPEDGTWKLNGQVFDGIFNPSVGVGVHLIKYIIEDGQCGDTTSIEIEVVPLPDITIIPDRKEGCSPLEVNFTNTSDPAAVKCIWDLGNGETSTDCSPSTTYLEIGCYDVKLTTETAFGCSNTAIEEDLICVHPDPIAEFTGEPNPIKVTNPVVYFTNLSTLNDENLWDFAGVDQSELVNPSYRFPEVEGTFPVCLKVTTEHGCVDSICHEIKIIDEFFIYVPNAFTPNNDGVNDSFFPVMRGYSQDDFKMQIYNRWGEILYLSKDPEERWDGTYRKKTYEEAQENNAYFQKQEVYIWKIKAKDKYTGKVHRLMGHVTLLR